MDTRNGPPAAAAFTPTDVHQALAWAIPGESLALDLDAGGTRVRLPRRLREAPGMTPQRRRSLQRAVHEHQDELLRDALIADGLRRFRAYLESERGADPDGAECLAALATLGEEPALSYFDAVNSAYADAELGDFKKALSRYLRRALSAFDAARRGENEAPGGDASPAPSDALATAS